MQDNLRLLWQPGAEGEAVLYRIYGTSPVVKIPESVEDKKITAIGAYCFSDKNRVPEGVKECVPVTEGDAGEIGRTDHELSGNFIEEVILPDTIRKIDNGAFFNCRGLKQMEIGSGGLTIGSDVFNNCIQLKKLVIRGSVRQASGVRQVLNRISWDMETEFRDARVLYPEYYESYDTIAPAHIFGLSIEGEGFRARQCFREDVVDFPAYDEIFAKACGEESVGTLAVMALNRLMAPIDLAEEKKIVYENYVRKNAGTILGFLVGKKELERLEFICRNQSVDVTALNEAVEKAVSEEWTEGAASLMEWKQKFFAVDKKKRYEF